MRKWQFPPLLTSVKTIWIGYSGGMDSHVLLHALAQSYPLAQLRAIHINHRLHPHASAWNKHCKIICQALGIPLDSIEVDAKPQAGNSPEATARNARYNAYKSLLTQDDCLVTAHHLDDQAETVLLQLLRGAGIAGLAAMPSITPLGKGKHLRPFLPYPREALLRYAKEQGLLWVEDSSNQDLRYTRNYLRHTIMPLLKSYWRGASKTIARSAQHCAEANNQLQELAAQDFTACFNNQTKTLLISNLLNLSSARRRQVIRYWLRQMKIPLPQFAHIQRIEQDLLLVRKDAESQVAWGDIKLCRYRNQLYRLPRQMPQAYDSKVWLWDMQQVLILPNGQLTAQKVKGKGYKMLTQVTVRFRQGGERCHPLGRQGSHPLKKLFQEWNVPPWERGCLPLIYSGEEVIAVPGYCIAQNYAVKPSEYGWQIDWQKL